MYPEYDPNEPTLGQSFANLLRGVTDPNAWKQTGQSAVQTAQMIPNVAESLARGGVAQAVGTMGDLSDLRNTVQSYLPKSVQNFSNAAEFMTNPYAKALTQTAPTTEETLDFVPRATAPYEGYKQHETLGEYIAPSLGYFGTKALKAGKDLPIGLSIEDVTPPPAKVAEALRQPEKNALGFYSPLEEAVGNLQNQKGTGQQYLAQLLKTQGVKQEEVATRGLDTFLTENPKVTREQIAQYLRENPVELKETVLGADSPRQSDGMSYENYRLGEGQPIDDPEYIRSRADDIVYDYESNNPDIVQMMRENSMEELGFTPKDLENPYNEAKFQQYVENRIYDDALEQAKTEYWDNPYSEYTDEFGYRVVGNNDVGYHVTDPNGRTLRASDNGIYDIDEVEQAIRDDAVEQGLLHYADEEYGTKYHDYTLPNGENYREVLIQYKPKQSFADSIRELTPEDKQRLGVDKGVLAKVKNTWGYYANREEAENVLRSRMPEYQSGHFDEPNILAHFRTTDRTIDGKKTLFVEEIQSDWHQAGRKKGYAADVSKQLKEIDAERQQLLDVKRQALEDAKPYTDKDMDAPQEIQDRYTAADDRLTALQNQQNKLGKGVPDAPFKKNWQELAMKRAMQMAAEGGYDRVAFTTGKQQAERYNLSKQVDQINWMPYESNGSTKVVRIQPNNGNTIELRLSPEGAVMNGGQFEGKTIDEVIGKDIAKKIMDENTGDLSGVNLDIGGEGMKGFYDKILPDFINKYGKKHGLKVGKADLPITAQDQIDIIKANAGRAYGVGSDTYNQAVKNQYESVHYFDLTPEAKESFLKKGQPMFAAAPAIGITDEDTRREVLEKLFNSKK